MPKRITTEEWIDRCKNVHGDNYDYSDSEYTGGRNKVSVRCKKHGVFEVNGKNHLDGSKCKKCSNEKRTLTQSEFLAKANLAHNSVYDYSKSIYRQGASKITITCREHGDFEQRANSHLRGDGCPECAKGSGRSSQSLFLEKCVLVHGDVYDYSKTKYVNAKTKVIIGCEIHGDFEQIANEHTRGRGCHKCAAMSMSNGKTRFIEKASEMHNNKYDYAKVEYVNNKTKVIITCPNHGDFEQKPGAHINNGDGVGNGCPKCTHRQSKGELELIELIESLYSGPIETSIKPSFFPNDRELDVYLPDLKLAFEYNGVWSHNELHKDRLYHKQKTDWCRDAGVRLVHIWEDDWLNRNEVESKFVKSLLTKPKKAVYARKLQMIEIADVEAKAFLNEHHIQGFVGGTTKLALMHDGDVVAVGVFKKRSDNRQELIRFASSMPVVGGLGKMTKYVAKVHGTPVVTFCDDARFSGESYLKAGYRVIGNSAPDYKYVVKGERKHKFGFRKKTIMQNYPDVKPGTEKEMMLSLGIYRIYDAGKTKYEYNIT